MDGSKLAALGWQAQTSFEDGLAATVDWFRANEAWWRATRSGDWDGWYQRQYAQRFATSAAAAPTPTEAAATPRAAAATPTHD
jgi:dTDP-glucose 4,6-dehydratase